jgi:Cu-processing system permease protein
MLKIFKYTLYDLLRSRSIIAYAVLLLSISLALFSLESNPERAVLSLVSIILFVVPLVGIVFATIQYYNATEFTELLLVQPLPRGRIILGQVLAQGTALSVAFIVGVALPLVLFSAGSHAFILGAAGLLLSWVFTALAYAVSVHNRDKARGIGIGLVLWVLFAVLYDGLLLLFIFVFRDFPIELWVVPLASFNPIDMGRIAILLDLDVSAVLGYTGAVYKRFFNSALGIVYALGMMLVWITVPILLLVRSFGKKDF